MDKFRTVGKLLYNACRYKLLKYSGKPGPLESISLEVTHHCICRCQMCNIWQIPKEVPDLPLADWTRLLSSPELFSLRELDITGGEPFLRKDLGDLLKWICRSKPSFFPKLKTLAITTNGIITDRILAVTNVLIDDLEGQGIDLVLACGMDAVGERHDHIRNFKGAWLRLEETLAGLKKLRESHPQLILGIKTTIIPDNVDELELIFDYARAENLFTIISPRIITANRFGNITLQDNLKFSSTDLQKIAAFYTETDHAWSSHSQTLLEYLKTGVVNKPCSAGFNTLFVRHNGDIFSCPIIARRLGNIKQGLLGDLRANPEATSFRKDIGSFPECSRCTEPGLERIAWTFEGFRCLRRLTRRGFADFSEWLNHMGLDKYL